MAVRIFEIGSTQSSYGTIQFATLSPKPEANAPVSYGVDPRTYW